MKEPWRKSSKFKALGQMLLTNQRIDKLSHARQFYLAHNMVNEDIIRNLPKHSQFISNTRTADPVLRESDILGKIRMAHTRGKLYKNSPLF